MPLTLNTSPPPHTKMVSEPLLKTMNIIPRSRLAVATSTASQDDTTRRDQECLLKVPIVKLDVDIISDVMASSLASSFLAHLLFLKNQVPLPVMQLARLSNAKRNNNATNNTRTFKQCTELLATYDTLASHLNTTFTALSTSFARCKRLDAFSQARSQPTTCKRDNSNNEDVGTRDSQKLVRVYMAILIGPSIGSARSKALFGVDGLEAKVWGEREDTLLVGDDESELEEDEDGESEDEESDEDDDEENEESEEEDGEESEGYKDNPGAEVEEFTNGEEFDEQEELESSDEDEDEDEATPPPSSPAISSDSSSCSPSPSPSVSPKPQIALIPPFKPSPTHSQPHIPPTQAISPASKSHAHQQQTLLNAERLLSRTLALADADGYCLASDMTPTQTHILIRAPRRFSHPAWIPRQNVTASMEKALEEFLEESGITLPADRSFQNKGNRRKAGQKNIKKVEGVWVVGRRSEIGKSDADDANREVRVEDEGREPEGEMYENDDMIWWSWDGKLVGFSDW